jgi:carbonic anhydrase
MSTLIESAPQNGLAGLRHWQHDLRAGFLVALISVPFSIGIAVASGAPPVTGLTSAIIAGLILPFFGGSYVTISGPAAGLAPVLYGAMLTLGQGNLQAGYPLLLPVIMVAGVMQLLLAWLKVARFSAMFFVPVVEGMLAAIGLMIMAKQLPTLIGHPFAAHEFWGIVLDTPHELLTANPAILALGLGTLTLLGVLNWASHRVALVRLLTPQLLAVVVGTLVAHWLLPLTAQHLINLPANPLVHGVTWPDFAGLLNTPSLWGTALGIALTLTLVDGIESLATIHAIDKIDPYARQSNPNKTLFAVGVSNICSSLIGGLTIIPGGIKSTANILAGGRTQWANFYNACFLIIFAVGLHQYISLLPLAVLAAVLVFTGFKLCKPAVWQHSYKTGPEQFAMFAFTVGLTLTTDLLWGILGGMAFGLAINMAMVWQANRKQPVPLSWWALFTSCFTNPVHYRRLDQDDHYHLYLGKPLLCSNYVHLAREMQQIPTQTARLSLHVTEKVLMIDHTIMDNLTRWMAHWSATHQCPVDVKGLHAMDRLTPLPSATHISRLQTPAVLTLVQ